MHVQSCSPCTGSYNNVVVFDTAVVAVLDRFAISAAFEMRLSDLWLLIAARMSACQPLSSSRSLHTTYTLEAAATAKTEPTRPRVLPNNIVEKESDNRRSKGVERQAESWLSKRERERKGFNGLGVDPRSRVRMI